MRKIVLTEKQKYERTTWGGMVVNRRTKGALDAAAKRFGRPFLLSQGSYNHSVAASGGTHDGGGVVDAKVAGMSYADQVRLTKCLRQVGFAAWLRTPEDGFPYHIHAVCIGDKQMSWSARNQVYSYFRGRNGLANNGVDRLAHAVGRPFPWWVSRYTSTKPTGDVPPKPVPAAAKKVVAVVKKAVARVLKKQITLKDVVYDRRHDGSTDAAITEALRLLGIADTKRYWRKGIITAATRESSRDWRAVNGWDSNAHGPRQADGYPLYCSRGVMQVIPQTFVKYWEPGTSTNIYDGVANIVASMKYVMAVYGVARDGHNLAAKVQQFDATRHPRGY
jgi:hypothetical protein